jgi:hypothetical protein
MPAKAGSPAAWHMGNAMFAARFRCLIFAAIPEHANRRHLSGELPGPETAHRFRNRNISPCRLIECLNRTRSRPLSSENARTCFRVKKCATGVRIMSLRMFQAISPKSVSPGSAVRLEKFDSSGKIPHPRAGWVIRLTDLDQSHLRASNRKAPSFAGARLLPLTTGIERTKIKSPFSNGLVSYHFPFFFLQD